MSRKSIPAAALSLMLGTAAVGAEGYYSSGYKDIGFDLTQIGGYGELKINMQGFGKMGYGTCTVNFTRKADGSIDQMAPVLQQSSATCPEEIEFQAAPAKGGLYQLTFTKGGALTSQPFDLFPVLQPMREDLKITAPEGFDILGMTIGMTRAEIEALLKAEGYEELESYKGRQNYQGGFSKATALWARGTDANGRPADAIAITYTALFENEAGEEKVEVLGRRWQIPSESNLTLAALRKSLDAKHGALASPVGENRFYDRSGKLQPKAFTEVCDPELHLQKVRSSLTEVGFGEEMDLAISCGASVQVMSLEDYSAPGRAGQLIVQLRKGDVAYESFWNTWSRGEEAALKERYDLQAGGSTEGPRL